MKKSTRNVLLGTGAVAAGVGAAAAASYTAMKKLVGIAMDRKAPEHIAKSKSKISGSAAGTHQGEAFKEAGTALAECGCETVEIKSRDGLTLVGHWYAGREPKRVLIAMHGWRSSWTRDFGVIAPFWHENDCAVLYAEQRAQGDSEGEYMGFGMLERHDCMEWVRWVNARTGGTLPIYLVGISMGATTVLMTAAEDLPTNVRGIIADCGFTSIHAVWKHVVGHNLHIPYNGIRAAFADRMCREKIELGTQDYSTVEALSASKLPVLLIHGGEDHFVPVDMTYENFEACQSPKYLYVVPGADHGMSYLVDREGYEQQVLQFWAQYDVPSEPAEEELPAEEIQP